MRKLLAVFAILICGCSAAWAQDAVNAPGAVMRWLDTITGKVREFEIRAGETLEFGRLSIVLIQCRYLPDNPATNSYAYVRIRDTHLAEVVFDAWMIASAPALSAMNHPRYDVWLIRCRTEEVDSEGG